MDSRSKTNDDDKVFVILRKARFTPKFEEPIENHQTANKKGRPEEHSMGFLTGFLALFSNPLLH